MWLPYFSFNVLVEIQHLFPAPAPFSFIFATRGYLDVDDRVTARVIDRCAKQ
jgi:hypothetical protein